MNPAAPVTYVATIALGDYLPDAVTYHDSAAEAWEYLWDEYSRAAFDAEQDVPLNVSHDFTSARHLGVLGTLRHPTPGYDGDHDQGTSYSVDSFAGVVCADCHARFPTTEAGSLHWIAEHNLTD